jgi:hypothetical protein
MERGLLAQPRPLDLDEQEYLDANPGALPDEFHDEFPDDDLAGALRQYGPNRRADTAGRLAAASPSSLRTAAASIPTLHEFLAAAGQDNPGVPRSRLATYWNDTYGHVDPKTLPTWETFFPAALKDNLGRSERELKRYWHETYGGFGVSEKNRIQKSGR